MVTERFKDFYLQPLAAAEVLEEMIGGETDVEAVKEVLSIATCLTDKWDTVRALAERQLKVIGVIDRLKKDGRE